MKVHIIGCGVVGLATGKLFSRFGHKVAWSDINPMAGYRPVPGQLAAKNAIPREDFSVWGRDPVPNVHLHLVCTPEEAAPDVVRRLSAEQRDADGWEKMWARIIIRSSVPPGTTAALAKELAQPLWHWPEFLRAAVAEDDVLWADHAIVGDTGHATYSPLEEFLEQAGQKVTHCTSTESEMVKLLTNNYLATLISFWNEAKKLCDASEVNSHTVARLVAQDPRVSKVGAYKHGGPYGLACLPKDLAQMLTFAEKTKVEVPLLRAVQAVNIAYGGS